MLELGVMIFLILTQAFFSGIEIGFVSLFRSKLLYRLVNGDRAAKILNRFNSNPHTFFSTILVGVNLVSVAIATLFGGYLHRMGIENFELWTPIILLPILTIFGESLPKLTFKKYNYRLTFFFSYLLQFSYIILYPLVQVFSYSVKFLQRIFGMSVGGKDIDNEELRVATFELIKTYGGDKMIRFNEGLTNMIEIPSIEFFARCAPPLLSLRLSTREAAKIITNAGSECGYLNIKNEFYSASLRSLLFSDNIKEALEKPLLFSGKEPLGRALLEVSKRDNSMVGFTDESGKVINIFTRNDFFERVFFRAFSSTI